MDEFDSPKEIVQESIKQQRILLSGFGSLIEEIGKKKLTEAQNPRHVAISLAGAVLISGVVALTLSPMMCSRLLPPKTKLKSNAFSDFIETIMNVLAHGYQASLKNLLMRPKLFLVGFSGVLLLGLFLFYKIPSELAPQEDESLIQAWVQGPDGATIDSLIPYTIQIEDLLSSVPEHNNLWSDTQRTGIFAGIQLKPWSQRSRSQQEIIDSLRKVGRKTPGVKS